MGRAIVEAIGAQFAESVGTANVLTVLSVGWQLVCVWRRCRWGRGVHAISECHSARAAERRVL